MKFIFFFSVLFIASTVLAQKKNFTIEEAVLGMSGKFAPGNLKHLQWADTTSYSFVLADANQEKLIYTDANYFEPDTILTLQKLNELLSPIGVKPLSVFPAHTWLSPKTFYASEGNTYYYINLRRKDSMYAKKNVYVTRGCTKY